MELKPSLNIYCTKALRELWPAPLASWWSQQYPNIFDSDDLRIPNQPSYHFCEWFTAIHMFHAFAAHSLVEKYLFANHQQKGEQLLRISGADKLKKLVAICEKFEVQSPDFFVYVPGDACPVMRAR